VISDDLEVIELLDIVARAAGGPLGLAGLCRALLLHQPLELGLGEALLGGVGERLGAEALGGAGEIALVRPGLDLAEDALPVLGERVVARDDLRHLEAQAGVADLLLAQQPDAPVDVLARDQRLELLDTGEVLLVESAQALDALLELFDGLLLRGVIQVAARRGGAWPATGPPSYDGSACCDSGD
jgi:hypothetical protein